MESFVKKSEIIIREIFQAISVPVSTSSPTDLTTSPPASSASTPSSSPTYTSSSTLTYTVAPTTSTLADIQGKLIILWIMR